MIRRGEPRRSATLAPSPEIATQRYSEGGRRLLRRYGVFGFLLAVLGFLVILPVGMLVYASLTDIAPRPGAGVGNLTGANYAALGSSGNLLALRNSLLIGLGGGGLAMFIGCSLAWLATRTDIPGKALVQVAGIVPLFVSSLVGALAWSLIASPRAGYLNIVMADLGIPWSVNVYSIPGMVFVFGLYYAPYSFLFVQSALTLMNPELEEAGEVHGGELRRVVGNITFPLVRPALFGAALLTFVLVFENFPIPTILGASARIDSMPSRIFRLMTGAPARVNEAAALGMVLMAIMVTLIYIQRRALAARDYTTVTGKGHKPKVMALGRWRWPSFLFASSYFVLAVLFPAFALIQSGLRQHQFIASAASLFDFEAFSFDNVHFVLDYSPFQVGLRNTVILGVVTAVVGTALHFLLAYQVERGGSPGRGVLEYLAMAPAGVPALVIGMGFLWGWLTLHEWIPLYGTLAILALAYIARFMPQGFRGIASTLGQIHPDLEDSARVSGASHLRATWSITIPLVRAGVVSTMLLLVILSTRELSTSIFLFTRDTRILSVVLFEQWASGEWPRVAIISLIYSLILLVLTVVGRRWINFGKSTP